MKKIIFFLLLMVLLPFLSVKAVTLAKLTYGRAYIVKPTGKMLKMKRHKKYTLKNNYGIKTSRKTKVVVLLPNKSKLLILSDTKWKIIDEKKGAFSLWKGMIRGVKRLGKKHHHKLYIPTAVVGVRGTEYSVAVADDGSAICMVDEGDVEVFNPLGAKKELKKGDTTEVSISEPENPKDIKNVQSSEAGFFKWVKGENDWVLSNPDTAVASMVDYADKINEIKPVATGKEKDNIEEVKQLHGIAVTMHNNYADFISKYDKIFSKKEKKLLATLARKNKEIEKKYKDLEKQIQKKMKHYNKRINKKWKKYDKY